MSGAEDSGSPRCSELSERAGEPIGGTATVAQSWLLVEVPGPWPRDVADGDGLPTRARAAVQAWLERTPSSRLLFVRRPGRASAERRLVFVVRAGEEAGEARRLDVGSLEELDDLDLTAAGRAVDGGRVVLVCGHGSRDRCCALRGTAVFTALGPHLGADELWLSSHQGGHRFAANVLVLPSGVHFGRVRPSEAPALVAKALADRIDLVRYRGRTAYERNVQAAELAVREAHGLDGIAELRLVAVEGERVRFRDRDDREYEAEVEVEAGPAISVSCGAAPEAQEVFTARLR